ncbi:HipA domain-containing protein [Aquirufa sp. ROCK2-A2]
MSKLEINRCPGTLSLGFTTYSRTCIKRVFNGSKVNHVLPYNSLLSNLNSDGSFEENASRISISGVQEKFSLIQLKNKIRLTKEGENGTHILKPIPNGSKNADQMPANEHLTMQIARQVFGIETAENAIIFFGNGDPAYITKRFDVLPDGRKWAQEDFASLAGKSPQTHGTDYKYQGSYWDFFELMRKNLPSYKVESLKLFKLLVFNYLFSNGDAHLKNFSVIETPLGDFKLSPAYDLLNSRIHIDDKDFALDEGLIQAALGQGNVATQFRMLANQAGIPEKQITSILALMVSRTDDVKKLIDASFLKESIQRNYLQSYQMRLKKLNK